MDAACFLNEIADKLANGSVSSRDLASLEFEADGRDISIRARSMSHAPWYPSLRLILGRIGSTCVDRGVTLSQLRRITFGEKEIILELSQRDGRAGKIVAFPIEATLGLPASDFSAAAD
jgi:hypothetical protein